MAAARLRRQAGCVRAPADLGVDGAECLGDRWRSPRLVGGQERARLTCSGHPVLGRRELKRDFPMIRREHQVGGLERAAG